MHELCCFDGEIISSEPYVSARSSSCLYGKGIFTTVAVLGGNPFLWEKHWKRLCNNAEQLRLDITSISEEVLRLGIDQLISENRIANGRARFTLFDESSRGTVWPFQTDRKTSFLIITADPKPRLETTRLTVSPFGVNSTSPLAGIKSCNYMENILAMDEAKDRGFDEAVRINERGEVTSACMANIFWVKGGTPFTPGLSTGCLPGTTREFTIEHLACEEVESEIGELMTADSVFLTSAGLGISKVSEIDGREFAISSDEMTDLIPSTQ